MNTPEEWALYHTKAFAMTGEGDLEGILSWGRTFVAGGASVSGLMAATDWMILNVSPQWRREHLIHIQQFLKSAKASRATVRKPTLDNHSAFCGSCDDTGFIAVPDPRDMPGGVWNEKYECVVACPCARGDAQVNAFAARNLSLRRLVSYEHEFPDWREQMFRKQSHRREMALRDSEAKEADKTAGPLVKRIIRRIGKMI